MKRFSVWTLAGCILCLLSASCFSGTAPRYDMDLVVDYDSGAFSGTLMLQFANPTEQSLSDIFLRVYANDPTLYGDAFVNVSDVFVQSASCSITWYVGDTVVEIPLETPLAPGERAELQLSFQGQASMWASSGTSPAHTGYGILTKSPLSLTLTAFYPLLAVYAEEGWALDPSTGFGDTLMSDAADYVVRISVREGVLPVASGTVQSKEVTDAGATYTFAIDAARDFSLVLLDESYGVTADRAGDTAINTWFLGAHELAQRVANEMAVNAHQLYEQLIGPCSYREIDLVEVPLHAAAGVEFSGLILVGEDYGDRPSDVFFTIIISHEMAHQWFYAGVGNDVSEHPWLDESFATYLSYVYLETYVGDAAAEGAWDDARTTYANAERSRDDLSVASPRYAFPSSSIYSAYVYSGGALLLDRLRSELGDDRFYRGVQSYYRNFVHEMATPQDLLRAFEGACECSITEVLNEFRIVPPWNLPSDSV